MQRLSEQLVMLTGYRRFVIKNPAPLQCSRLYCIEPVGVGTPLVESLTGYLSRLAQAHLLSVAMLFGYELAPFVRKVYLSRASLRSKYQCGLFGSAFLSNARAMNGCGLIASDWLRVLQKLTLRSDLQSLTMLSWSAVLSHNQLLKPTRAWCSLCYGEWQTKRKTIYEPLLWAIKVVTACPSHRVPLKINCPHCGKSLHPLASRSRPGFCSSCGEWLGQRKESVVIVNETLKHRVWDAEAVGTLLAAASNLKAQPEREGFVKSLAIHIGRHKGMLPTLARLLRVNHTTIWQWYKGNNLLQLDSLLRLCSHLSLSPLDVLIGNTDQPLTFGITVPSQEAEMEKAATVRRRKPLDRAEAKRVLEAAIKETPPPSLQDVAARLGRDGNTLRYWFARLCKKVVERYAPYRKVRSAEKWDEVENTMNRILTEESPPPSMAEVARRLGRDMKILRLRYPNLCRAISRSFLKHSKANRSQVQNALLNFLDESPPLSLLECARRTGISKSSFYKFCPELCHEVSARFLKYRKFGWLNASKRSRAKGRRAA